MNQAFIDGQNLAMGTKFAEVPWSIDWRRFRIYLREKYLVDKAYYFIGSFENRLKKLYQYLEEDDFILVFRKHSEEMVGNKKGNVDTDIVFSIMKKLIEQEDFNQVVLVSGDGDYFRMVEYLIKKDKFKKLLAPNRQVVSSLYKSVPDRFISYIDQEPIRNRIAYKVRGNKKVGSP